MIPYFQGIGIPRPRVVLPGQGRRQRGGRRGLQPPYCLRNKGTLLQSSLKFSAINECLGVEEGVHTLDCTTMEPSFTLL
jgi:hypothetical protein